MAEVILFFDFFVEVVLIRFAGVPDDACEGGTGRFAGADVPGFRLLPRTFTGVRSISL